MPDFLKKPFIPFLCKAGKRIEKKRFVNEPVYIGGCGRSGTTLLLSILSAHSDIFACPEELNLFQDARIANDSIHLPYFYRLYRTFLTVKIKKTANRYCEKSPANVQHLAEIDRLHHGKFKFIHIIRDGRDVLLSKHPKRAGTYWVTPQRWVRDVRLGLEWKDHPAVMTIRYEELVRDFEIVIDRICNFLSIPVSEEIMNWHEHTTVKKNKALYAPIREINDHSIGKWKTTPDKERLEEIMASGETVQLLGELEYIQ